MKKTATAILLFLCSCNAGRTIFSFDDVVLNEDGTLTTPSGKKPIQKKIVYKGDLSNLRFYADGMTYEDEKQLIHKTSKSTVHKKKCVHIFSYYIPLNFWTWQSMDSTKMAKEIIEENKKNAPQAKTMQNNAIVEYWGGTPLYSYECKVVFGTIKPEK